MIRNAMASLAALMLLVGVPALAQEATQSPTGAAAAATDAKLESVRARAKSATAKESQKADEVLAKEAKGIDAEASAKGDVTVANRIGADVQETTDAVMAERTKYGAGWGELLIAHTLVAKSTTGLTLDEVFQLRSEGMGWGQIVRGMDLKLGKVTSAVEANAHAATGGTKAQGQSGEGGSHGSPDHGASAAASRAGEGASHAKSGTGGSMRSLPGAGGHGGR